MKANEKPEAEEVILTEDPRAATFRTDISGWVSRKGIYFGNRKNSESAARYDGATHSTCRHCGQAAQKGWTACDECREADAAKKWAALPAKPWKGDPDEGPVYSETTDRFYYDWDDIIFEMEDDCLDFEELRLVRCEPQFPQTVDPEDHLRELLPEDEDDDIPADILAAFARLNEFLSDYKRPLSWAPVRIRVEMTGDDNQTGEG